MDVVGGYRYYCLFASRRSRTTRVYLMRKEGEIPRVLDQFLHDYFADHHELPTTVFCDNAAVNIGDRSRRVLQKRGVRLRTTIPHQSEQNPAERYIRTVTTVARRIL